MVIKLFDSKTLFPIVFKCILNLTETLSTSKFEFFFINIMILCISIEKMFIQRKLQK